MDRNHNSEYGGPQYPPRIKAAFQFLGYTRLITWQTDAAIPPRELTSLEKSVETAALRAVQQYLLCEMDFREDAAETSDGKKDISSPPAESADKGAD
jgi:hypothetical protein